MALSAPRVAFGVHSCTPYNTSTGEFYGILKVLKGSSLSLSGELQKLMGGASKYPWAVEDGAISAEMSLKFSEYPDFVFTLFLGATPTATTADTDGDVSTAANKYGTSVISAANGISGVAATGADESDLKFGKYVIKATGTAAFDLYYSSDCDIGRSNNGTYESDLLKVTASPLSVASGNAVSTAFGLTFTKAGTPNFTTGDTAQFMVRPINSKAMSVNVGAVADQTFPEFGAIVMSQKRGNQEMLELDAFRCKAAGMPINFESNAFSEAEVKINLMYDSGRDGVFSVRHVSPT